MSDQDALAALVASRSQGILAAVKRDGHPHLSNVLYVWDAQERVARVSTTAGRVKARVLRRDPHAALHVSGDHFWRFAVAEGTAELSGVATEPGDGACRELLELHSAFYGDLEEDAFFAQMIAAERLVVRLRVTRLYGVLLDTPPGG
jgi:PPOX class probable F420-dependent enzyme